MCGNSMSVLQSPIIAGDTDALLEVLNRYQIAIPLLLQKQFIPDDNCMELSPVYTTPLKFCIYRNEPECLRTLLEFGGNPNETGDCGTTLLHKACKKVSIDCVKVLLDFGADIYRGDEWGVLPIHACVATYGDFDDSRKILDILLEAGDSADINIPDREYGKLPLHYAAFYGNVKLCEYLLSLGVDINAKDKHGRTAYQCTERRPKTRKFLESRGCEIPKPPPKKPLLPLFAATNTNNVTTSDPVNNIDNSGSQVGLLGAGENNAMTQSVDHEVSQQQAPVSPVDQVTCATTEVEHMTPVSPVDQVICATTEVEHMTPVSTLETAHIIDTVAFQSNRERTS